MSVEHIQKSVNGVIAYLKENGIKGTVVIQDPATGRLLAMASWPSYDPTLFARKISLEKFQELSRDPRTPLVNRATIGATPGSALRALPALAAAREGLADLEIQCPAKIKIGDLFFHDWDKPRNEKLTLAPAVAKAVRKKAIDFQAARKSWAFRPHTNPKPPAA